jgi:hypothetical protein
MKNEEMKALLISAGFEITDDIKLDVIHKGVNDFGTNLVKTKVDEALKNVDGSQYVNEFLKSNEFSNEEAFKDFVKTTKDNMTDIEKVKADYDKKLQVYDEKIKGFDTYREENEKLALENKFIQAGVKDVEYATFKYSQNKDSEGFELDKFINEDLKTNHSHIFGDSPSKTPSGVLKPVNPGAGGSEGLDTIAERMGLNPGDIK